MTDMAKQLEHLSVCLAVTVVALLPLNFVIAHHLEQPFETRFLLSGVMLLSVAVYLRFLVIQVGPLHRAVYRVATTMAIWSLGFYFLPYPVTILYLVAAPAGFFLCRIEVKGPAARDEDIIAAGVLLGLTVLLYCQQQALQVLLFRDAVFDWSSFYRNAPVMVLVGIGFVRLQKRAAWHGLASLGLLFLLTGVVLSIILALGTVQVPLAEAWTAALCAHAMVAVIVLEHRLAAFFQRCAGLVEEQWEQFRSQAYGLAVCLLHVAAVHGLRQVPLSAWSVPVLVLCVLGWPYRFRQVSVSLALIECALWIYPVLFLLFSCAPFVVFPIALSLPLIVTVALRRTAVSTTLIPNATFTVLALLYVAVVVHSAAFNLRNFALALWLLVIWSTLPERPMTVERRYHYLFWPVVSGFYFVCQQGGFDAAMLPPWAVSLILPPLLLTAGLRIPAVTRYAISRDWLFVQDWLAHAGTSMVHLTLLAYGAVLAGFLLLPDAFATGWLEVGLTGCVLVMGTAICSYRAVVHQQVVFVTMTEVSLWLLLGLLRWKVDAMALLTRTSPLDAYLLLGISTVVAGMREVLKDKAPRLRTHLVRSMQLYGSLGWLWGLVVQFLTTGRWHGEIGSVYMCLLHTFLSRTQNKTNVVPAFLFGNVALLLFFYNHAYRHSLFFLTPVLASVLALAQLFKAELGANRLQTIRLLCSLIMLGTSTVFNATDFEVSIWYPVTAALMSAAGVVLGISLRVRIFLYLGAAFFICNTVAVSVHLILGQPPEHTKLIVGIVFLVTGAVFTGSFLLFQMKRHEILSRYRALQKELAGWE